MSETLDDDLDRTAVAVIDERTQAVGQPQSEATQYAANIDCPVCRTPNAPTEQYCTDCGFLLASAPVALEQMPEPVSAGKLVTPDGTREFFLKPGANTVGRENSDVLLSHNTVSRRHALITVDDSRAWVEDSGSTNGTFVGGSRIAEKTELTDGCEIVFGSFALKYLAPERVEAPEPEPEADQETLDLFAAEPESEPARDEESVAAAAAEEAASEVELPAGRLVSVDGSLSFPLKPGANALGRRAGANDVVVPDPYCSGRHADIKVENGVFTVIDVGSTNGTLVNGVRLQANIPRQVQEGDEIIFGQTVFRIEAA